MIIVINTSIINTVISLNSHFPNFCVSYTCISLTLGLFHKKLYSLYRRKLRPKCTTLSQFLELYGIRYRGLRRCIPRYLHGFHIMSALFENGPFHICLTCKSCDRVLILCQLELYLYDIVLRKISDVISQIEVYSDGYSLHNDEIEHHTK